MEWLYIHMYGMVIHTHVWNGYTYTCMEWLYIHMYGMAIHTHACQCNSIRRVTYLCEFSRASTMVSGRNSVGKFAGDTSPTSFPILALCPISSVNNRVLVLIKYSKVVTI